MSFTFCLRGGFAFWSRVRVLPPQRGLRRICIPICIRITNMKLIVKNRAGAKVLPDGLEVKDVRFEIGPTTCSLKFT